MKLGVVDSEGDTILEVRKNVSLDKHHAVTIDYMQNSIDNLENKGSEIFLSCISENNTCIELQLDSLSNSYKTTSSNNTKYNSAKSEWSLLQNMEDCDRKIITQDKSKLKGGICMSVINNKNIPDEDSDLKVTSAFHRSISTSVLNNIMPDETKICCTLEKNTFDQATNKCHIVELAEKTKNHKNNYCDIKSIMSLNRNKINVENLNLMDKQDKTCSQCLMTFRYKRHLDRHLEGHQKNNCSHCNAKFARRKHLEVHLFRCHGERVTQYPYSCDVCPRSFPKRTLLNRHRAKHDYKNGKVCPECGEMLKAEIDDKKHKENHCIKRQFECKRCLQTFSIEQTYQAHLQNHNNHKCSACDVTFASKKKAQEHYKLVHSPKLDSAKVPNNGIYFCADCRRTFLKKDDYSRHLESTLHLSKASKDTNVRSTFNCSICSKKLISRQALDQHVRRTHRGEKRFTCNIYGCTFQCARKTDLDRHKQLHVEQRNVVCEHCGKTFTSVSILNDHVLYVHNKERQFICEECGKAFKRNSLLKRHKLSHQQHRPFACMQCSTAFKRSHHLTRHLENCHRIMLERKRKVVKLMKTEDGHLVPVPEKPKKLKSNKVRNRKECDLEPDISEQPHSFNTNTAPESLDSDFQVQPLRNSNEHTSNSNSSLEFSNLLSTIESTPHVLSLVNINSGQVVTVEVTSPETLAMNDLIDQFETNCNEILSLPDYNDLEFQTEILNTDQNYYDHNNYSELPLGNVEGTSLLLDSNSAKMDTLPAIENYLAQPFPPFLNL